MVTAPFALCAGFKTMLLFGQPLLGEIADRVLLASLVLLFLVLISRKLSPLIYDFIIVKMTCKWYHAFLSRPVSRLCVRGDRKTLEG